MADQANTANIKTAVMMVDETVIYNSYPGAMQPIREVCVCVCVWQTNLHYISIKMEIKQKTKNYYY